MCMCQRMDGDGLWAGWDAGKCCTETQEGSLQSHHASCCWTFTIWCSDVFSKLCKACCIAIFQMTVFKSSHHSSYEWTNLCPLRRNGGSKARVFGCDRNRKLLHACKQQQLQDVWCCKSVRFIITGQHFLVKKKEQRMMLTPGWLWQDFSWLCHAPIGSGIYL